MLIRIKELNDEHSPCYDLGIRWNTIDLLEKYNVLKKIEIDKIKYIDLDRLLNHMDWEKNFVKNHLIDLEVWDKIGAHASKDTLRSSGIKMLINLAKQGYIEMVELNYSLLTIQDKKYTRIKRFFNKSSVEAFQADYISIAVAKTMMNKSINYLASMLKNKGIEIIRLAKKYDLMFVKKLDILNLIATGNDIFTNEEKINALNISEFSDYINNKQASILLNITPNKFKKIVDLDYFKVEKRLINNRFLYNKEHLIDFKNQQGKWELNFLETHLTEQEVWGYLGFNSLVTRQGKETFISLDSIGIFKKVELEIPLLFNNAEKYKGKQIFFNKKLVEEFITNHIKLESAANLFNRKVDGIAKYLRSLNVEIIKFSSKNDYMFVNKNLINGLLKKKNHIVTEEEKLNIQLDSSDYLNRKQVMQYLNLTSKRIAQFIDNKILKVEVTKGNNLTLFNKKRVLELRKNQEKLKKILDEKWYTRNEILEIYDKDPDRFPIRKNPIPFLVASDKRFLNKRVVYLKKSAVEVFKKIEFDQQYYIDVGSIYENMMHRLRMEQFSFGISLSQTEELWNLYVENKSNKWNPKTYEDKHQRIAVLVALSKDMGSKLTKEIYNYSSKELNLAFFNKNYPLHYQKHLYAFLQAIYLSQKVQNKVTFRINDVNNPYDREQKKKVKSIYTAKEYRKIFNYVSDNLDFHKKTALNDIRNALNARETNKNLNQFYNRYDSAWLFVLLHLTNIWRTPDFISFPRVSFDDTTIEPTLEWLENNEISRQDAERILRRLQIKTYKFSKNSSDRGLFIPENLIMAFVNAVTICEVRTRLLNDNYSSIIDFMTKDKRFRNKVKDTFFKGYDGVQFDTLKMNQSVYSYVIGLSRKGEGVHELEALKHFRGHKNVETTNIYLLFDQEDINFLTSQLFSRNDSFGFIADTFTDILYGETTSLLEKTERNNFLVESISDVLKLESVANFLLAATPEENLLKDIIMDMDSGDIRNKVEDILFENLPSKKKNVQCLIGEDSCPYAGRDCLDGCHYSIPHFFAISELTRKIWSDLEYIVNEFVGLKNKGEKEKIVINFVDKLRVLKKAEQKYGEVIYEFFDLKVEDWKSLLNNLPEEWQFFLSQNKHLLSNNGTTKGGTI